MFKKLTDFSYKRSGLQAFGFYLAYLFLGSILGAISGVVYAAVTGTSGMMIGMKAGAFIAVIYCAVLGFLVLWFRKLYKRFSSILLYLLSILASTMLGSLLGLVFISIMTTMKTPESEPSEKLPETGNDPDRSE
jgi:hypothetical protein